MGRAAPSTQPVLGLLVTAGPAEGLRASKQSAKFVAGRRKGLGFSVPDSAVSERHAEFSWNGSAYVVKDMGSSNGTALNGTALAEGEAVELNDQDLVQLGLETIVRVEVLSPPATMEEMTVEEFLEADVKRMQHQIRRRGEVLCELLRNDLERAISESSSAEAMAA